jgi:hypothetical protein
MDELINKTLLLGAFRVFVVHFTWLYTRVQASDVERTTFENHTAGLRHIAASLGVEINIEHLFPYGLEDDNIGWTLYRNCLEPDRLASQIETSYGKRARFAHSIAVFGVMAAIISDWTAKITSSHSLKRHNIFRTVNLAEVSEALFETAAFYQDNLPFIEDILGPDIATSCTFFMRHCVTGQRSAEYFRKASTLASSVVNILIPDYPVISEKLIQANQLERELSECQPGTKDWRQYEDICYRVLRFLFIPPFRELSPQVRTEGNYERRDAVLMNDQPSWFWASIGSQFDSKHVVFEFKNTGHLNSKNALNQLRIYLLKPTIGRFGMLLTRNRPSKAVLQARREAYEQSRILVLILDDLTVTDLLMARCFLGSVDEYLQRLKREFEIGY